MRRKKLKKTITSVIVAVVALAVVLGVLRVCQKGSDSGRQKSELSSYALQRG